MKKLALIVALATFSLVNAQNSETAANSEINRQREGQLNPDQKAKRDADRAEKTLGLAADQKAKWESAAKERIMANAPLKEKAKTSSSDTDKKELRQQMMNNNKKFDETVVAFLTPEQKAKWDQQKSERKQHRKAHMQKQGN